MLAVGVLCLWLLAARTRDEIVGEAPLTGGTPFEAGCSQLAAEG
jgi:hypothetical protein